MAEERSDHLEFVEVEGKTYLRGAWPEAFVANRVWLDGLPKRWARLDGKRLSMWLANTNATYVCKDYDPQEDEHAEFVFHRLYAVEVKPVPGEAEPPPAPTPQQEMEAAEKKMRELFGPGSTGTGPTTAPNSLSVAVVVHEPKVWIPERDARGAEARIFQRVLKAQRERERVAGFIPYMRPAMREVPITPSANLWKMDWEVVRQVDANMDHGVSLNSGFAVQQARQNAWTKWAIKYLEAAGFRVQFPEYSAPTEARTEDALDNETPATDNPAPEPDPVDLVAEDERLLLEWMIEQGKAVKEVPYPEDIERAGRVMSDLLIEARRRWSNTEADPKAEEAERLKRWCGSGADVWQKLGGGGEMGG